MRSSLTNTDPPYREVRGLARGLAVIRAINAMAGGMGGVLDVAKATGLHRTTVKRLLETLRTEGLVTRLDNGSVYSLTREVKRLSEGYAGSDWIDDIAAPLMVKHHRELAWPSDLAIPNGGFMVVRESTHRHSMLSQHHATIGERIPMLVSSLGRAWLAHCPDEERESTLSTLRARQDETGEIARDQQRLRQLLSDTRQRGYGLNIGEWRSEASVTAIAYPILDGRYAIGAINLVLMRNAVSEADITRRYVPSLRKLARRISTRVGKRSRGT